MTSHSARTMRGVFETVVIYSFYISEINFGANPLEGSLQKWKISVLPARNRSFVRRGFRRKKPFSFQAQSCPRLFRTLPLTLLRQTAAYKYFQFFCPTVCLESVFRPKKNSFLWAFCTSASQTHRGCGQRFAIWGVFLALVVSRPLSKLCNHQHSKLFWLVAWRMCESARERAAA